MENLFFNLPKTFTNPRILLTAQSFRNGMVSMCGEAGKTNSISNFDKSPT